MYHEGLEDDPEDDDAEATSDTARAALGARRLLAKVGPPLIVFFVLTFMHALALLVFKFCAVNGSYPFSPASALVCTEATKLVLATWLHRHEIRGMPEATRPVGLLDSFRLTATPAVWTATAVIAALYTVNNLLSYYLVAKTDPGTLAIAKATVPYLCAVLLRLLGRPLTDLQWCCIMLQCAGVVVTQSRPGGGVYSAPLYVVLLLSVVVTASSSVFNERIIKTFAAPLQQINMIMYAAGVVLAAGCFFLVPGYADKRFFEGYSLTTLLLIFVQAVYGLCVGYAYKYADVIIKNLSSSTTLALLVFVSAAFFHVPLTVYSVTGLVIIVSTSYLYLRHNSTAGGDQRAKRCCGLRPPRTRRAHTTARRPSCRASRSSCCARGIARPTWWRRLRLRGRRVAAEGGRVQRRPAEVVSHGEFTRRAPAVRLCRRGEKRPKHRRVPALHGGPHRRAAVRVADRAVDAALLQKELTSPIRIPSAAQR